MIEGRDGEVVLRVKVVPNASRAGIVGPLGGALKVKVAAPAEGGKANRAACKLIADALGLAAGSVVVDRGAAQPHKRLLITGVTVDRARRRLAARPEG